MRKIEYPETKFKDAYLKIFSTTLKNKINTKLKSAPKFDEKEITLERLLVMPFDELLRLKEDAGFNNFVTSCNFKVKKKNEKGVKVQVERNFNDLFNYDYHREKIHDFFNKNFHFKVCHYCGIEYINAFLDINTNSNHIQLQLNGGDEYRNHFTLDHVIAQNDCKYLSLCLCNFVPSCYSCNSRFKHDRLFDLGDQLKYIIPTSSAFSISMDYKFRILYSDELKSIRKGSDFVLDRKLLDKKEAIEEYLKMFKIDARYIAHKDILLDMIERKSDYSPKKIKEMAKLLRKSEQEIKELIFGKDIFEENLDVPLHKLKRDIAENIKVI